MFSVISLLYENVILSSVAFAKIGLDKFLSLFYSTSFVFLSVGVCIYLVAQCFTK